MVGERVTEQIKIRFSNIVTDTKDIIDRLNPLSPSCKTTLDILSDIERRFIMANRRILR